MELKDHLTADLRDAMRAGDDLKKTTLRMALAAIKNAEIDTRAPLPEPAVLAIVQKEVKNRRESIADAETAKRPDLVAGAEAEIAILEAYLPQQISESELRDLARAAIAESGADSARQMGDVMKILMPRVQGRADGKQAGAIVRELLEG
ncbi:MAG TPA: GatB/YqeY domain-containing protein [Anaerolineales bacterium]|nr:GatB/YqeY domain-containing protein [Anaerolineales bacterium]